MIERYKFKGRLELHTQEEYWQKQLLDLSSAEIRLDYQQSQMLSFLQAQETFIINSHLSMQVRQFCMRENLTCSTLLLAAFQITLMRYLATEDILVGSLCSDSVRKTENGQFEVFTNPVGLRTSMASSVRARSALEQVVKTVVEAAQHRDYPFDQLIEQMGWEEHVSTTPILQLMFIPLELPFELSETMLTEGHLAAVENYLAQSQLILLASETETNLSLQLDYSVDWFQSMTMQRFLGHIATVLEGIISHPEQPLYALPLLTETERQQILVAWNQTHSDYPQDIGLHEVFEAQACRTPDAIALLYEDQRLTYYELNSRANQLAHHLRTLGVDSEVLVGIYAERSLDVAVGILGTLKAAGAYVPLDPQYPQARLAFMLDDAQVAVILTQQAMVASLPPHRAEILCLDTDWEQIAQQSTANLAHDQVAAETPAYVIYTSGSTGQPKGVAGLHCNTLNRLHWMWETYPFASDEIGCQKTALSFVDAVWEFFGPLLQGIPSVIIPDHVVRNPHDLVTTLASHGVTRLVLVPSLLRVLLATDIDFEHQVPRLTLWTSSGEVLPTALYERFRHRVPQGRLLNLYGSTEVGADATYYDTSHDGVQADRSLASVPIGRPIANTDLYVLDAHLQPVPIGVAGELYIGGACLARGYLNRPDLTQSHFVSSPLSLGPSKRLYKTGDRVRYLAEGHLDYLGRFDDQVNIRGYRVELGEIEAVLVQHPALLDTAASVHEDASGDQRVIAYFVPRWEPAASPGELRGFLQTKLPDYMVPSIFVALEMMPRLPNGKVDRRALPAPQGPHEISDEASVPSWREGITAPFVAPRTPIEVQIAEIWSELLRIEPIGVNDNFIELGGHSLLAAQILTRVHKTFQVHLTTRDFIEQPTIAGLAGLLMQVGDDIHDTVLNQMLAEVEALSLEETRARLHETQSPRPPSQHQKD